MAKHVEQTGHEEVSEQLRLVGLPEFIDERMDEVCFVDSRVLAFGEDSAKLQEVSLVSQQEGY